MYFRVRFKFNSVHLKKELPKTIISYLEGTLLQNLAVFGVNFCKEE